MKKKSWLCKHFGCLDSGSTELNVLWMSNSDFQPKHSMHSHGDCLNFHSSGGPWERKSISAEYGISGPCNRALEEIRNRGREGHFCKVLESQQRAMNEAEVVWTANTVAGTRDSVSIGGQQEAVSTERA